MALPQDDLATAHGATLPAHLWSNSSEDLARLLMALGLERVPLAPAKVGGKARGGAKGGGRGSGRGLGKRSRCVLYLKPKL